MIGPLLLFAAAHSALFAPANRPVAKFVPDAGATVRARASVRILSAAKFGPGRSEDAPGALRRNARVTDQQAQAQDAILMVFLYLSELSAERHR